nr:MAG TPA: hypothetical protein [Caudoviricetes sp.]DAS70574.1 MAG TPA: hypothetical protein [Caudoviricetes sp.]
MTYRWDSNPRHRRLSPPAVTCFFKLRIRICPI